MPICLYVSLSFRKERFETMRLSSYPRNNSTIELDTNIKQQSYYSVSTLKSYSAFGHLPQNRHRDITEDFIGTQNREF